MMNKIYPLFFLICITFSSGNLFSQSKDFGIYTGFSLSHDLSDKLQISFDNEIRFTNNVSVFDKYYLQTSLKYNIIKPLKFGIHYRFWQTNVQSGHLSNQHSIRTDLTYKTNINRLEILLRSRLQSKYSDYLSSELGKIPSSYLRNKISLIYNIRKSPFEPFCSFEAFKPLNNNEPSKIDKLRYTGGIDYKINKKTDLEMIYYLSKEINTPTPENTYILGIHLTYQI